MRFSPRSTRSARTHDARPDPMMEIPSGEAALEADRSSLREELDGITLLRRARTPRCTLLRAHVGSERSSRVPPVESYALADYDADLMLEANGRWTIAGGTRALVAGIAGDVDGGRPHGDGGRGRRPGRRWRHAPSLPGATTAEAATVAVPLNTLGAISFDPRLAPLKEEAAAQGSAGARRHVRATLGSDYPFSFSTALDRFPRRTRRRNLGARTGIRWSSRSARPPSGSPSPTTRPSPPRSKTCRRGLASTRSEGTTGCATSFSRGTWAAYAPGHPAPLGVGARAAGGRIAFAGSDIARGWGAYMDGATETGFRAADEIQAILS